jgi:cold shock protein
LTSAANRRDVSGRLAQNVARGAEDTWLRLLQFVLSLQYNFIDRALGSSAHIPLLGVTPVQSHGFFDAQRSFAPGNALFSEDTMSTGTVKFFNPAKGFGFIQPDDGSKDVFVHISAVERAGLGTINENDKLSFDVEKGDKGKLAATNLKKV